MQRKNAGTKMAVAGSFAKRCWNQLGEELCVVFLPHFSNSKCTKRERQGRVLLVEISKRAKEKAAGACIFDFKIYL